MQRTEELSCLRLEGSQDSIRALLWAPLLSPDSDVPVFNPITSLPHPQHFLRKRPRADSQYQGDRVFKWWPHLQVTGLEMSPWPGQPMQRWFSRASQRSREAQAPLSVNTPSYVNKESTRHFNTYIEQINISNTQTLMTNYALHETVTRFIKHINS